MEYPSKSVPGYINSKPGIQVGTKFESKFIRDEKGNLQIENMEKVDYLKQIGVEWVMTFGHQFPEHTAETYLEAKEILAGHGLKIYCLHSNGYHNMPDITLNLANRDKMIEGYLKHIERLGAAGIHYSTYAHMGNGIWRNVQRHAVRGGAMSGGLDLNAPMFARQGSWGDFKLPLSHGRVFTEDEMWKNYEYFIKQVVPVAESGGVHIGIHPDDPMVYTIGGVPRCIFGTYEGYKRALDIANSPNIGVCLCVGCWIEGGDEVGCTPEEFIRYLGERNKLFKLHVRNVTAPLSAPGGFDETYPDAGYYNLVNVLEALDEIGYDGAIINDHLVEMVGGRYTSEAYFTAWLKGAVAGVQNKRFK